MFYPRSARSNESSGSCQAGKTAWDKNKITWYYCSTLLHKTKYWGHQALTPFVCKDTEAVEGGPIRKMGACVSYFASDSACAFACTCSSFVCTSFSVSVPLSESISVSPSDFDSDSDSVQILLLFCCCCFCFCFRFCFCF